MVQIKRMVRIDDFQVVLLDAVIAGPDHAGMLLADQGQKTGMLGTDRPFADVADGLDPAGILSAGKAMQNIDVHGVVLQVKRKKKRG
jgi:hypothetical protein